MNLKKTYVYRTAMTLIWRAAYRTYCWAEDRRPAGGWLND